jgi:DNA-binding transcriptional LysR family regulator
METKWLEDFVSLAETRSFSRSAQLRHVTQPAFSRRIQALEAWAGTDLVDRSSYPTHLTPAGQTLYAQALEMLQGLQTTRAMLRGHVTAGQGMIEFAVPHTLAFTFFPAWLSELREQFGPIKSRLIALNVHDAVLRLVEGSCDLLIAYHNDAQPIALDPQRYEMVVLGQEWLSPWVAPSADGSALWSLPGQAAAPVPYLAYASGAYLAQVTELLQRHAPTPLHLDRVYETDMAEGLKVMALEGHGLAFLPTSAVRAELAAGRLVPADEGGLGPLRMTLDIRAWRQKPGREGARHVQGAAQALWDYLVAQAPGSAAAG